MSTSGVEPRSDRERWQRARAVFEAVVELATAEREARLLAECADDPALLEEVRALLAADGENDPGRDTRWLDNAAPDLLDDLDETASASESGAWVGTRLGAWQLQQQIGRGGMGAVYLAERADGAYQQQAAVKLIRTDWDSAELLRRFHSERQILARLQHPHIAHLLDGGVTADGKPYLVMEYIAGRTIIEYCDTQRLNIAQRLALFLTVCSAVEHAHRNLVVHRDLKPSNILVDDQGQVKLLDFGIAKALESDGARTATAARSYTPGYAAPEQLRGEEVTTSVDVHALGLLLFELLSGERPFATADSTPAAQERAVLERDPPPPSRASHSDRAWSTARAKARDTDVVGLQSRLRGDLDAIVLLALRKDPAQRYPSVSALADDVRRYLSKQPVQARQGHLRYRATRFLQRHALATGLGTLALLLLVSGLILALWQADQTRQQRDVARIEAQKASAVAGFLTELFRGADPYRTDGVMPTVRDLLDRAIERIDARDDLATEVRASLLVTMAEAYEGLGQWEPAAALHGRAVAETERAGQARLQILALGGLSRHAVHMNRHQDALELAQARLRLLDQHTPEDAALRRALRITLGSTLRHLGREAEAVDQLLAVHNEALALGEAGMRDLASLMPGLVASLVRLGRVEEALRLTGPRFREVIDDPELRLVYAIPFLNAHALALGRTERFDELETTLRVYLERAIRLYGDDDLRITAAYLHLAEFLWKRQRSEEAIVAVDKVLLIRRRELTPGHDQLVGALLTAANIHAEAGDYDTALAHALEAVQIQHGKGAADSRLGVRALYIKARLHELRGDYPQATEEMARVLPFVRGEPDHLSGVHAAPPLLLHARLQHRAGQLAEDCASLDRILGLDPIRPEHLIEARILAAACASQHGNPARAAELLAAVPETLPEQELTDYARALYQQLAPAAASSDG